MNKAIFEILLLHIYAIKAAVILPIISELIGFTKEAMLAVEASENEAAALRAKVATLEAQVADKDVILQKVANAPAKAPVFSQDAIERTLGRLQGLNVLNEEMATKIASDIQKDPAAILGVLEKISEAVAFNEQFTEGHGVAKEASTDNDKSDPDGWDEFAAGREVKLRQ